jgi:regulator of protease activity HflC (stomatin/prohibitin superfamily)
LELQTKGVIPMSGITGFLGLLSLLGGVAFLGGIGLVVVSASQGRPVRGGIFLAIMGLAVFLVFAVVGQGLLVVPNARAAVVYNVWDGSIDPNPRGPGTSVLIPGFQIATEYPLQQEILQLSDDPNVGNVGVSDPVDARSIDGQVVTMDISVIYSLDITRLNDIHTRWQDRYLSDFIIPTVRSLTRDVVSDYRAEAIYGQGRTEMEAAMEVAVEARFAEEGIILNDLLVRAITFSTEFTDSIERAQIASQDAQQAELRVEQIRQEAEQRRAEAQGLRDAAILEAEGDAQAIVLRAQAEAEALRLVSEQIAANPLLIQYLYVQNLSDNVNIALVPANSPFLFDMSTFAPDPDFTAPAVPTTEIIPTATPVP